MAQTSSRVLCLAGIDPTGAAGLLRDLWAAAEAGVEGCGVPTCLTVQGAGRPATLQGVGAGYLRAALDAVLAGGPPAAVKVGLVDSVATWETLLPYLEGLGADGTRVVVDPVRGPSAGGFEAADGVRAFLVDRVAPLGTILTPNLPELTWVGGDARALVAAGAAGVLVKGGHRAPRAGTVTDTWDDAAGTHRLVRPRHAGPERRGTGCVLSTLLAAGLARGLAPLDAARQAGHMVWQLWPRLRTATPG